MRFALVTHYRPWTEDDVEHLRELVAAGASAARAFSSRYVIPDRIGPNPVVRYRQTRHSRDQYRARKRATSGNNALEYANIPGDGLRSH
jgi:hypothetical protein